MMSTLHIRWGSWKSKGCCMNKSVPNVDKGEGVKKSKNLRMSLMDAPIFDINSGSPLMASYNHRIFV